MHEPWYVVGFEEHYLELYAHRNEAEAKRSLNLLRGEGIDLDTAGPWLDLACGGGRHLAAMQAAGTRAVGLDLSPPLLSACRRRLGDDQLLVRGDMRRIPFGDGRFGGVLSMFTSFGYFPEDDENWRVMAEAKRVLRPGGKLLFDFLNRELVLSTLQAESERSGERWRALERRRVEAGRVMKTVRIMPRGSDEILCQYEESVRLFRPEELRSGFARLGFREVACWGDYGGDAWHPLSPRFILLLQRGPV